MGADQVRPDQTGHDQLQLDQIWIDRTKLDTNAYKQTKMDQTGTDWFRQESSMDAKPSVQRLPTKEQEECSLVGVSSEYLPPNTYQSQR